MAPLLLLAGLLAFGLIVPSVSLEASESRPDSALSCSPDAILELIQRHGQDRSWNSLAHNLEENPDCAWLQRDWAVISLRSGRLAEARQWLEAIAGQHADSPALHFGQGLNLLYDRSAPDALEQSRSHFEKALALIDEQAGSPGADHAVCHGFCLLALSAMAQGPEETVRLIEESRSRFATGGSFAGQGLALKQLASFRERQGDVAEALRCAEEALACFEREDCLGGSPLALHLAGNALSRLGETGRAVECYRHSLERAEPQGDDDCRLRNMINLGLLARADDAEEALRWFDKSIPVARGLGMDHMLLWALQVRARFCGTELNRYRTALDNYAEALTLARKNSYWSTAAHCLDSLGHIRSYLGDYDAALLDFQAAAELIDSRQMADPQLESSINRGMGYLLWKNGAEEEALARLERAAASSEAGGDMDGLANALHLRGAVLSRTNRPAEARPVLLRALEAYDSLTDTYGQASVSYTLGRTAEAMGDGVRAAERYRASARLGDDGDYPILAWSSNYRLGRLALATGDLPEARERLESALKTIRQTRTHQTEDTLKWSYMEDKHQVFCTYADVLEQQEGAEASFAAAEQAHASALLDLLSDDEPASPGRFTTEEARGVVPEGGCLIEYLLGEDSSFLFLLDSAGLAVHRLPPREALESAVAGYLVQLRQPARSVEEAPSSDLVTAGRLLHSLLLGPAQGRLSKTAGRLIIVPDGLLHHLPFEALILPGNGPPRYLAQQHELAYAHSAAVLARLSALKPVDPEENRLDLLAIGDPDFGDREWIENGGLRHPLPPLPHSGREVRRIGRRLEHARVFTGRKANKSLLEDRDLVRARVIHLATHALVDEVSATGSAIVFSLSGGDGQEGLLRLEEVGSLGLDADLVVLSACSTGLGRPVRGEGVVGLSRAFISAGSRSVVHTLWPVEDSYTAGLMERFFAGLCRGRPKAAALADARHISVERGDHPHFWAPFVLVGESSSTLQLEPRQGRAWLLPLLLIALGIIVVAAGIRMLRRRLTNRS